jgi:hypothetical protein
VSTEQGETIRCPGCNAKCISGYYQREHMARYNEYIVNAIAIYCPQCDRIYSSRPAYSMDKIDRFNKLFLNAQTDTEWNAPTYLNVHNGVDYLW